MGARKRSSFQDNMGIKEISIAGSENVKVDLAPIEELMVTTQCCCTACSFYTKWPECCGVNKRDMLCCCSTELGFGCFQYKDEHKKIQSVVSTSTCLDYTGEKTIWHEAATEVIACFCIKGASKATWHCLLLHAAVRKRYQGELSGFRWRWRWRWRRSSLKQLHLVRPKAASPPLRPLLGPPARKCGGGGGSDVQQASVWSRLQQNIPSGQVG